MMNSEFPSETPAMMPHDPAEAPGQDQLTRFLLERAGVRGVRVRLAETWSQIRASDAYPPAVAAMLGEASAAAALFTGHAKIDGRLSVQLRSDGALRTLFAECTAAGTLRGIAQLSEDGEPAPHDLRSLGAHAVLAITIENNGAAGREPVRYQGVVPLESETLSRAFEQYFLQSEQLPTRLLLAADDHRAAGLMLQKLPGDEGDDDGWNRASVLFETISTADLLDMPTAALLQRVFHEDDPRLLGERPLRFACSCSRERVAAMLESLGQGEAREAVIDGAARVRCEFCGRRYAFLPEEIDALFTPSPGQIEAPDRLQ